LSLGFSSLFNYLLLFLIFLVFYTVLSFFIYYRREIDFSSARNTVLLSVTFVLVKFLFEEVLLVLNPPISFSEIIYLVDTFILVLISDILEVPQRYLRRISCIFLAVIIAVFLYELFYFVSFSPF